MTRLLSLWLEPEPVTASTLSDVIAGLAAAHGTAAFAPHVTIVGGFAGVATEVASRVAGLRAALPIDVTFDGVDLQDVLVRSLYLRPAKTEALQALHNSAVTALDMSTEPYEPHLSLMYSDLPMAQREPLAADLSSGLPIRVRLDQLSLWSTPEGRFHEWRRLFQWPAGA